jgi:hypothetical protein
MLYAICNSALKVSIHTFEDLAAGTEQMHRIVILYVHLSIYNLMMKNLNLTVICSVKF